MRCSPPLMEPLLRARGASDLEARLAKTRRLVPNRSAPEHLICMQLLPNAARQRGIQIGGSRSRPFR